MPGHYHLEVHPERLRAAARELNQLAQHVRTKAADVSRTPGEIGDRWQGAAASSVKENMTALGYQMNRYDERFAAAHRALTALAEDYEHALEVTIPDLDKRYREAQAAFDAAESTADQARTDATAPVDGRPVNGYQRREAGDAHASALGDASGARSRTWGGLDDEFEELKRELRIKTRAAGASLADATVVPVSDSQVEEFRRRSATAGGPAPMRIGALELFDDTSLTLAGDRQKAADARITEAEQLARRIEANHKLDGDYGEMMHDIAGDLKALEEDPDALATFWATLSPQTVQALPDLLQASGSDTAQQDLETFSRMLGVAFTATEPPDGFTRLTETFTSVPEDGLVAPFSWSRMALLEYGDFPAPWLADVVRANGLDQFADGDMRDDRGGTRSFNLDVSESLLALNFKVLGNNPEAARLAFQGLEYEKGLDPGRLVDTVLDYAGGRGTGDDILDGFGEAAEAASGVPDEAAGQHLYRSAHFAEEFIKAISERTDVGWTMKDSVSSIAASYAHELVASLKPFHDPVAGLDPAFTLTDRQVYGLLRTFADDNQFTQPFDQAMGQLYLATLSRAADVDRAAIAQGAQDPDNFEEASAAFGAMAGLEFESQKTVRGEMDEADERFAGIMKDVITFPLGFVPGDEYLQKGFTKLTEEGATLAWNVAQYGVGKGLDQGFDVPEDKTRVGQLEDASTKIALSHEYVVTQALLNSGFAHTPLPASVGSGDQLKDFSHIDPHAFQQWLNDNSQSAGPENKIRSGDLQFLGAKDKSAATASEWEEDH